MVEAVVKCALDKLTDSMVKEALKSYHVDKQVETVCTELKWIHYIIEGVDKKRITDRMQNHWLKDVRDVAYSIEDSINIFLMDIPQKSTGMREAIKRMLRRTKNIPAVSQLVNDMYWIRTMIETIEERIVTYRIYNFGRGDIVLPHRPTLIPKVDPDIVGFTEEVDHVVSELLDKTNKRRSVVSIWGVGGAGKTTLTQKVYNRNDVKGQFELHMWVTISQKFELIDVLKGMGKTMQFSDLEHSYENIFLNELYESLRGKKYLIVLDDVWSNYLWLKIGAVFPEENNGSRILLTTRSFCVAKAASTYEPYKLGFLSKELSLELFLKKANHDGSAFDDYLLDITNQFVHKCGGLPLALVCLGNLLAMKPKDYTSWSNVLQTMSWHTHVKECSEIIGTSFEDLPFVLKSCFMYFAAFPENYVIDAKLLLQIWIAEGFIPQEKNRTLEYTAKSFLEDLAQRSMIEATVTNTDGSIKSCHLLDVFHDLAIQKAKEDNFLVVYSQSYNKPRLSLERRVAIHQSDCHELMMSPNLRTLLCFHSECVPNCLKQRLLKVVSIQGDPSKTKIAMEMFEGLCHLRYLHLEGCSDKCESEYSIGSMKYLQTSNIHCAWLTKKLR